MLASIPFLTLSSQTPSQLHSSCLCKLGTESASLLSIPLLLRYARHAFQAPEFPAASNGNVSKAVSSSKECFMYSRTSLILLRRLGGFEFSGRVRTLPTQDDSDVGEDVLELVSSDGGGLYKSFRWLAASACPSLTFLEFGSEVLALLWDRPNQCGNPCRRLKPPGGSRPSS